MEGAPQNARQTRDAIVHQTARLVVERGYADTSVDRICAAAGITKGAFFHHFRSKEDAAAAAVERFIEDTVTWQAAAPGADDPDPLRRMLAFVDHNVRFARETPPEPFGCILGTVAGELAQTRPRLRKAAASAMSRWTEPLLRDAKEAASRRRLKVDAKEVADHFTHAFQGGVVLARARDDPQQLAASLAAYRRYLEWTFQPRTPA